jgi:hypothetical protein
MNARDELTTLVLGKTAPRAADAILAAGYRKPRTINTLEELKTVYEGAILKDAEGELWGIDGASGRLFLVGDGNYDLYDDSELNLPATVVYEEPEATL